MKAPTYLKYLILSIALLTLCSKGNSQQLLWTTASDAKEKKIPKSQVLTEILKQYDFYEYYYDATGYTQESFSSMLKGGKGITGSSTSKNPKVDSRLAGIKEPTIFAWKDNTGNGSLVMVLSIDGDNVDMLVFSNHIESGSNSTNKFNRGKFTKWLNTMYKLESYTQETSGGIAANNKSNGIAESDLTPQLPSSISPDEPVQTVAVKPSFPGGETAFREYVGNEFQYPIRCQDEHINGSVVLRFVVDATGKISRVSAIEETKSCPEFTAEAIRILQRSPRWIPGQNKGRFVSSWREIPIRLTVE
jgi:TonB family protein